MRLVLSFLTLALVAGSVASTVRATTTETWVEPYNKDCTATPKAIGPQVFGTPVVGGAGNLRDLDVDGRVDGAAQGGTTEDNDGDAIYETLAAALSGTADPGIIYLATGYYREAVTVTKSVTIIGPADHSAILDGACSNLTRGIDITATGATVILENLTIQGYTSEGIRCDSSNLKLINCRIQANVGAGVQAPGSSYKFEMIDSQLLYNAGDGISQTGYPVNWLIQGSIIANNDDGIYASYTSSGVSTVTISDSQILRNADDGVFLEMTIAGATLSVRNSHVAANGDDGLELHSRNTGSLRVTGTTIEGNAGDGIYIQDNLGCSVVGTAPLGAVVTDSRILGNGSDGIDASGTGTSCSIGYTPGPTDVSVYLNTIAFNVGYGLNASTGGASYACGLGRNQLTYNVSGAQSGAWCTVSTDNKNQSP